jgi:hypothetical protein
VHLSAPPAHVGAPAAGVRARPRCLCIARTVAHPGASSGFGDLGDRTRMARSADASERYVALVVRERSSSTALSRPPGRLLRPWSRSAQADKPAGRLTRYQQCGAVCETTFSGQIRGSAAASLRSCDVEWPNHARLGHARASGTGVCWKLGVATGSALGSANRLAPLTGDWIGVANRSGRWREQIRHCPVRAALVFDTRLGIG